MNSQIDMKWQNMIAESDKSISIANDDTISIFIPMEIKKRGGTAMIIMPKNVNLEEGQKFFDDTMIKSIARAYKWKIMIDNEEVDSLADIARKENLSTSFVSKIFNLNFLAPKIVERILSGTQSRTLKLQDIAMNEIPDLWQEQLENWGFEKS
jgi:hypothetical protein